MPNPFRSRRPGAGPRWLFGLAALALLTAPVPPPLTARFNPVHPVAEPAAAAPATTRQPVVLAAAATRPTVRPRARAHVQPMPKSAFVVNGVLDLDAPIGAGDFAWNDDGVAAGATTIVIDLRAQRLSVYRGGIEIGRTSIIYGADEKPTPLGVFPILEKDRHHISNLYGAPMPYMLRLTMDGVSIHASEVDFDYATHGCIGVPSEFAAKLFAEAKVGDQVLVTNAWQPQIYWTRDAFAANGGA
jgi:lipoprotein-anchoring transpeptidase ErfK/SrfK